MTYRLRDARGSYTWRTGRKRRTPWTAALRRSFTASRSNWPIRRPSLVPKLQLGNPAQGVPKPEFGHVHKPF